jgi:geranylgeranyl transferase type-2 subunit beta
MSNVDQGSTDVIDFYREKHVEYILEQESHRTYEYWLSEHLRMNGLYWGITTLCIVNQIDKLDEADVTKFILSCWDEKNGGFGSFPRHDAHILSTLSALQVLRIYDDELKLISNKRPQIVKFIKSLQLPDGSFQGDKFGEIDTRFVYTGLSSLSILDELTNDIVEPAVKYIISCQNFDGSFGMVPGSESHAAQVFTCVGALAIADRLHLVENDTRLTSWLSERQVLPSGGLNGRPEKLPDVCYSWWVLSSLAILGKKHWIDLEKLEHFILTCQDEENGGISDRPDNQTDIYHTCFGTAGLSLIDHKKYGFIEVDPIYCMPLKVTQKFKKWKS